MGQVHYSLLSDVYRSRIRNLSAALNKEYSRYCFDHTITNLLLILGALLWF